MRFSRLRFILILLVLSVLSVPAMAAQDASIRGAYVQLPDKHFKFDGKTVEVIEFMSFYCGHCYSFERSIPIIKGNFPKKVMWRTMPIYWGEGSPKPGEAYFLAEEAGKGEQMKQAIFHALFVEKKDIGDIAVLEDIASKIGLGFGFSRRLRTGDKAKEAQRVRAMARSYRVQETPTVIIAGNLMAHAGLSNHNIDGLRENVISIIKSILQTR